MDLKELLGPYRNLGGRCATESDQEMLLEFFEKSQLTSSQMSLRYLRAPNFFSFLELHSQNYHVLVGGNDQSVSAVGTLVVRPGYINGQRENVVYLADLRIAFQRKYIKAWRDLYAQLLKNAPLIKELGGAKYFYTVLIDDNMQSRSALVMSDRSNYRYQVLARYKMTLFIARKFWTTKRAKTHSILSINALSENDVSEVEEFLDKEHRKRPFGYCYQEGELRRRFKEWPHYKSSQVYVLRKGKEILMVGGLWSPSPRKKIVLEHMPLWMKMAGSLFPGKMPKEGGELKINYITDFAFKRDIDPKVLQEATEIFFDFCYRKSADQHLAFCDFESQSLSERLKTKFWLNEIPMTAYLVHHKDNPPLAIPSNEAIGFEMCLV